jgi:hypothetical protein
MGNDRIEIWGVAIPGWAWSGLTELGAKLLLTRAGYGHTRPWVFDTKVLIQ